MSDSRSWVAPDANARKQRLRRLRRLGPLATGRDQLQLFAAYADELRRPEPPTFDEFWQSHAATNFDPVQFVQALLTSLRSDEVDRAVTEISSALAAVPTDSARMQSKRVTRPTDGTVEAMERFLQAFRGPRPPGGGQRWESTQVQQVQRRANMTAIATQLLDDMGVGRFSTPIRDRAQRPEPPRAQERPTANARPTSSARAAKRARMFAARIGGDRWRVMGRRSAAAARELRRSSSRFVERAGQVVTSLLDEASARRTRSSATGAPGPSQGDASRVAREPMATRPEAPRPPRVAPRPAAAEPVRPEPVVVNDFGGDSAVRDAFDAVLAQVERDRSPTDGDTVGTLRPRTITPDGEEVVGGLSEQAFSALRQRSLPTPRTRRRADLRSPSAEGGEGGVADGRPSNEGHSPADPASRVQRPHSEQPATRTGRARGTQRPRGTGRPGPGGL